MKTTKAVSRAVLDDEVRYFNESLDDWLNRFPGKLALVKGRELIGVFDTDNEALTEGARRYQLEPFLVRRIVRDQPNVTVPTLVLGILFGPATGLVLTDTGASTTAYSRSQRSRLLTSSGHPSPPPV